MPFNSKTYHRNKARRQAFEHLAAARALKARDMSASVEREVRLARAHWRVYLSFLRMKAMDADVKAVQDRRMTYAAFEAKWILQGAGQ